MIRTLKFWIIVLVGFMLAATLLVINIRPEKLHTHIIDMIPFAILLLGLIVMKLRRVYLKNPDQKISMIVARNQNCAIGRNNKIPWHCSHDLKYFKSFTMGKPMIMGRKTFESLPGILPGRKHIVLTNNKHLTSTNPNVVYVNSIDEALKAARNEPEICVVGGSQIYKQFLHLADTISISTIHVDVDDMFDTYLYMFNNYFDNYVDWKLESKMCEIVDCKYNGETFQTEYIVKIFKRK